MRDQKNDKHEKSEVSENKRRAFLKKAVYSTPGLIALGQLVKPVDVHADGTQSGNGSPDPHPDWW